MVINSGHSLCKCLPSWFFLETTAPHWIPPNQLIHYYPKYFSPLNPATVMSEFVGDMILCLKKSHFLDVFMWMKFAKKKTPWNTQNTSVFAWQYPLTSKFSKFSSLKKLEPCICRSCNVVQEEWKIPREHGSKNKTAIVIESFTKNILSASGNTFYRKKMENLEVLILSGLARIAPDIPESIWRKFWQALPNVPPFCSLKAPLLWKSKNLTSFHLGPEPPATRQITLGHPFLTWLPKRGIFIIHQ